MRYVISWKCSGCGEGDEYEMDASGGAVQSEEALRHRRMIEHSANGPGHIITLNAEARGERPRIATSLAREPTNE